MYETDLIISIQSIQYVMKAYERTLKKLCAEFGLTLLEAWIVGVMHSNPEMNTARDIAETRMLSKGNVSRAVENLIAKGYLSRRQDKRDRRLVYLSLQPAASAFTERLNEEWEKFGARLFYDFSEEELRTYDGFKERLLKNARDILDKGTDCRENEKITEEKKLCTKR